jgi:hypothetical protein
MSCRNAALHTQIASNTVCSGPGSTMCPNNTYCVPDPSRGNVVCTACARAYAVTLRRTELLLQCAVQRPVSQLHQRMCVCAVFVFVRDALCVRVMGAVLYLLCVSVVCAACVIKNGTMNQCGTFDCTPYLAGVSNNTGACTAFASGSVPQVRAFLVLGAVCACLCMCVVL